MKTLYPKPLNQQVVYHACEFLLITLPNISAADVQTHLSDNGYEDDLEYVQMQIQEFAADENWQCIGTDRYQFGDDTQEEVDTILCKNAQMIKIHVRKNIFTVKDLRKRNQQIKQYKSNRQAMFWAKEFLKKKMSNGYYKK